MNREWFPFFTAAIAAAGLCLVAGLTGEAGAWHLVLPVVGRLPAGGTMLWHVLTGIAGITATLLLPRGPAGPRRFAVILLVSLTCRLALLPQPPSDDVYRYLWEGRLIRLGLNPYALPPSDPSLARLAVADPFHAGINHPHMSAIYPPLSLLIFAAVGAVRYDPLALKLTLLLADMLVLLLLLRLLEYRRMPLRYALLYGLNPVILHGFAGQGHLDPLMIAALLAALHAWDRRRWSLMFLAWAVAVQTKYVAIICLPFLLDRDNWKRIWIALPVLAGPFLPFIGAGLFRSLETCGTALAFNGPVHRPLAALAGMTAASRACFLLFAAAWAGAIWMYHPRYGRLRPADPVPGCRMALTALVLCSPTVHLWYLAWVLPLAMMGPSPAWLVLSLSSAAAYAAPGLQALTGQWFLPAWVWLIQWAPFWLAWLVEIHPFLFRLAFPPCVSSKDEPAGVSVIVPVRNEASRVGDCVRTILDDPAVREVLVVDGGSRDSTMAAARAARARVLLHYDPPERGGGRGGQILTGLKAARHEVAVIVHADTLPERGLFTRINEILACQPSVAGGAAGGVFTGKARGTKFLGALNDARAVAGLSFGDQIQFFRRTPVLEAGAFVPLPLMEDVELSLRLLRLGSTVFLFSASRISDRKWRGPAWPRARMILGLLASYLLGRLRGVPDTVALYRQYYDVGGPEDPNYNGQSGPP